jgi:hypothetical protein
MRPAPGNNGEQQEYGQNDGREYGDHDTDRRIFSF